MGYGWRCRTWAKEEGTKENSSKQGDEGEQNHKYQLRADHVGGGPHGCSTVSRVEAGREAQKEKQRHQGARKQRTKSAAKKQAKRAVAEVQLQADHMGTGAPHGCSPVSKAEQQQAGQRQEQRQRGPG